MVGEKETVKWGGGRFGLEAANEGGGLEQKAAPLANKDKLGRQIDEDLDVDHVAQEIKHG